MTDKITVGKGEIIWISYLSEEHELLYLITSKSTRDTYYLYKIVDGKAVKTKYKNENPSELERYMSKLHRNE